MTTRVLPAVLILALALAACASDDQSTDDTAGADAETSTTATAADDPASDLATDEAMTPEAGTVTGEFALLDTAPAGLDEAAGEASLTRTADGTEATLDVTGLPADTDFTSHVHMLACADDGGGEHYKFDPAGGDMPPNEIHLDFTTDADGAAANAVTNDMTAGAEAMSIVIHYEDEKALCADLA